MSTVIVAVALARLTGVALGAGADDLLTKIKSSDAGVRSAAWAKAGPVGAPAVVPLGALIGGEDPGVARAATEAMRVIVHHAGRPGAAAERTAVEAELIKLLANDRPAKVRVEAAEMLSFIGGDAAVPALAGMLSEPPVRERARRALERIPGDAATSALIKALADADANFKPAIISTLGQRKAAAAVSPLLDALEGDNRTLAMAAAEALSRIAETPTREVDPQMFGDLTDAEQLHIGNLFLRYADGRAAKGDADAAVEVYERILGEARSEHLECAAIVGLGRLGPRSLSWLVPQLSDDRVAIRAVARDALVSMPGDGVNGRLEGELATATPPVRAMLLRVLAAREAPNAPKLLKEAAKDENAEVRVTAYDLIGGLDDPALEAALLEAAEWGSAAIKEVALASYLRVAGRHLKKGNKAKAGKMFTRSFDLASSSELRNEALTGLGLIADVDSLARVERAMDDPATAEAAGLAYVAIAAKIGAGGDKEKAIKMITAAATKGGAASVLDAATGRLKALGADVAKLSGQFGFITNWWLVGPFPSPNKLGFKRSYFPEEKVDLEAGGKFGKKELKWKKLKVEAVPAKIDLTKHFDPHDNVAAYGYAEFESPADREINLRIGTDDGCRVWLNGKEVHANNASRGFTLDHDTVATTLKKGKNTILIKVIQGGGDWAMCVRVADRENKPIEVD